MALAVAAVDLVLRALYLTNIPGINGDEASGAVLIREWLVGNAPPPWITQTHRFIPIYVGLASLFYGIGAPSYWQLRLFPFVAGLLTVVAVWFAARAVFHQRWVRIAVVLTSACLPIQLAYSRVAWDPALTSLTPLLFVTLILNGRHAWSLLGAAIGLLIHPTLVFFAPYGLLCFLAEVPRRYIKTRRNRALFVAGLFTASVPLAAWLYKSYLGTGGTGVLLQAYGWGTLKSYVLLIGGVITGSVPFESFVAKPSGTATGLFSALNVAVIVGLLWCTVRALRRTDIPRRRRLFPLGVLIALAVMYLVNPLQDADHDRYMLVFVVPIVFVLGLAVDDSNLSVAAQQRMAVLFPASLLAGYCVFYVGGFFSTGGRQFSPYQSGSLDPKFAAKEWIVTDSAARLGRRQPIHIVADSWWVFWPIRYLTMDDPFVRVQFVADPNPNLPPTARITSTANLEQALRVNGYAVGFSNGALASDVPKLHKSRVCDQRSFLDYVGRPSVVVHRLCPTR